MKRIIFLILLILVTDSIKSQWVSYATFNNPLYCITFTNGRTGFYSGDYQSKIFVTRNGGAYGAVLQLGVSNIYYDAFMVDQEIGYIVGSNATIYKCTEAGYGWTLQNSGAGNFYSVCFPSGNTGYAVGANSTAIMKKTTDSGNTWLSVSIPSINILKGVYFAVDLTGWICGSNGSLWKTIDGGATWSQQNLPLPGINLEKMFFINSATGLVVGSGGAVYKTTNGGSSWAIKQSSINADLYDICFTSPGLLWAAGNSSTIIKSTNNGETWFQQQVPAGYSIRAIHMAGIDTGYAVSSEGIFLRTINSGGVTGIVENGMPVEFSLKQNYPNPFNPSTQIEYSIQEPSEVKIIVYDVNGKIIITLVNEFKSSGTYSVDFDGTGFASGVYLYKLTANEFTDTRKMILIK